MNKYSIGIDLGGTRIKAVLMNADGEILQQIYRQTNDEEPGAWKSSVLQVVDELRGHIFEAEAVIGIAAPGLPNLSNSVIAFMPGRLAGLEQFNWSTVLNQRVWVLNDAVAALVGEARFGKAKGVSNAVLLTLGTGVGGAILIDGKPYQGSFQKAGHMGHLSVDHEGELDLTGMPGSLEEAIGNYSVERRSYGKFKDTYALLNAYQQGDYLAQLVWLTSVKKLAVAMASITNIISPECIVLAGGLTKAGKDLLQPLESYLALFEWRAGGNHTRITVSDFGDLAGAAGAASFAFDKV